MDTPYSVATAAPTISIAMKSQRLFVTTSSTPIKNLRISLNLNVSQTFYKVCETFRIEDDVRQVFISWGTISFAIGYKNPIIFNS
ncbi:MAG: hypothetical protein H0U72_07815 [Nitrosospira sp.]|nr:hypothetical protein [Nitrosospira sp.]